MPAPLKPQVLKKALSEETIKQTIEEYALEMQHLENAINISKRTNDPEGMMLAFKDILSRLERFQKDVRMNFQTEVGRNYRRDKELLDLYKARADHIEGLLRDSTMHPDPKFFRNEQELYESALHGGTNKRRNAANLETYLKSLRDEIGRLEPLVKHEQMMTKGEHSKLIERGMAQLQLGIQLRQTREAREKR